MPVSAIIFGGVGALVETSDLQRRAYNGAFRALNIAFMWNPAAYRESLSVNGGAARLSHIRLPNGAVLSPRQILALHDTKTRLFGDLLRTEKQPLRDGVAELLCQIKQNGMKLAWATTTSQENVDAIIATTQGALSHDMFAFIGNEKRITHQKPHPEIYQIALRELELEADSAWAIEDSPTGVVAAKQAGLHTIAFPGIMNLEKDFSMADSITNNLASVLFEPAI